MPTLNKVILLTNIVYDPIISELREFAYRIAEYNYWREYMFGGLLEKGRKLQLADINLAVTVRSPRLLGVYVVGAILAVYDRKSTNPPNIYNSPPIFPAIG